VAGGDFVKELQTLFRAGWNQLSTKGKNVLKLYTLGLTLVSGLDALALYLVSTSFQDPATYISKSGIWIGLGVAALFVSKSGLSAAISYWSVVELAKEEALIAQGNLERIEDSGWLNRVDETNSSLQNAIDRGPYLLTQSNLMGVCSVVAETLSALAIVVSIMILQPLTASILLLYFVLIILFQHKILSKVSTRIGTDVLNLTNKVYDFLSDFHGLSKILTVMKSKTFMAEIINNRNALSRARALQIFVSNLPRYFLEVVLLVGVAIVGSISYATSGTAGVLAAITLFSVAGFRLLPVVNRIQVLVFAMLGSAPIARTALLGKSGPQPECLTINARTPVGLAANELMRLENVSFKYPDRDAHAVKDVTLSLHKSKQYAIVGLSGSGKTTLVDLMLGLIEPTSGIIEIDLQLFNRIGYVPQDSILTAGSIAQNVALEWDPDHINFEKVQSALESAQANEKSIGIGINGVIGSSLSLSGGQRQRIGIARALYRDSKLLILDEATSALDSVTEREIMGTLDGFRKSCTTVVIAHRLATVEHVDEVIFLEAGKILGIGSFDYLRKNVPSFAAQIQAGMLSTEK
jgi:ABC-type multidrug transport system fused ATPase/permease subunit